jgi:hypothetical protein
MNDYDELLSSVKELAVGLTSALSSIFFIPITWRKAAISSA